MTFQDPNVLLNESTVDLSMLHPFSFGDVCGNNASDTVYLPVQPQLKDRGGWSSSLWKGFIATLRIRIDGQLELVQFDFPTSLDGRAPQVVNKVFTGDFSIIFRPFFRGPNTIVPFHNGTVVTDTTRWIVGDQFFTAEIISVVNDAGLRVMVCELPGFIPRSTLPTHLQQNLISLVGSQMKCKMVRSDGVHPPVYAPAYKNE